MNSDKFAVLSIRDGFKRHHVSYDIILGIENEFVNECGAELVCIDPDVCHNNMDAFWKYNEGASGAEDAGFDGGIADEKAINKLSDAKWVFFATMADNDLWIHLKTLKAVHEKLIIYIIDSWVPLWPAHEKVFKKIDPACVCCAYKKSAEHFSEVLDCKVLEVPQSMDATVFYPHDIKQNRLFIQIGRKNKMLHEQALLYLKNKGLSSADKNYAYQRVGKDYWINALKRPFNTFYKFFRYRSLAMLAFPSMEGVSKEISASKFSLCAPQCVDNSAKTGDISETTPRYYEIMACKSIPVGLKPMDTFDELFPYEDAMIEVDENTFARKIDELVKDESKYRSIVEKNYAYVMEHHRWKNRYALIMEELNR